MSDPAIAAQELCKTYAGSTGPVEAVAGVDLTVEAGEFLGLLGPNGAGKSTTIGMLTTLVVPTAGRAQVCGVDVVRQPVEVKRRIGMASQTNTLDRQLTVFENLEFRARYFGMGAGAARRRATELIELLELGDRKDAKVHELSGGQTKRVVIARALAHRPDVLFLDEPTAGIDPQTRHNLWDTLRTLHTEGQTILLTTHDMAEAETLCGRVAIIDHGSILACDEVERLKTGTGAESIVTVTYDGDPAPACATARDLPHVSRVEATEERVRVFTAEADGILGQLATAGAEHGLAIRDASTMRPSLETVFLTMTGREYRE
ncbi:ABC transporter ATP-binding protein [Halostreptopolyspora alba]|uniref:ABC transporter ATP-binding protein n=1 Tax=Halostreptopolyspora alba TaxID=2487137 RepID=UPI0026851F46